MKYRHRLLASAMALTLYCATGTSSADTHDVDEELMRMKRELLNLKHKIERLEKSRRAKKPAPPAPRKRWYEQIELNGLIEVEGSYTDAPTGSNSDLRLATVELGLDAQVTSWINGHVLFLFEEDETDPPEIDEAIITFANPATSPFSLAAGRLYLPFGNYQSRMVSDPLTLEIGESRETALQLGCTLDRFQALAYVFNGDTGEHGDDGIDGYGLALNYSIPAGGGQAGIDAGVSWISNIADSDTLQDSVSAPDRLVHQVPGLALHATATLGDLTLIGEYLTATRTFAPADLAFAGSGARPAAANLEAGYQFEAAGREAGVALAWQHTWEAAALILPQTRWLAALSLGVAHHTVVSLEYAHDQDYKRPRGGSGDDSNTLTAQLAVTF